MPATDASSPLPRSAPAGARRERADARRNRERVLAAARVVFEEQGPGASLEEIARRANVGIGTLYRHFPNRSALLDAVFADSVNALCEGAGKLLVDAPPIDALRTWLRQQLDHATTYGSLAASTMLESLGRAPTDDAAPGTSPCEAMRSTAALLLARAQAAGEVRDDVDADDVMRMVGAIALAVGDTHEPSARNETQADRLFSLMMDGLRVR